MDMIFKCPACGQELEVDDSGAGEEIDCPSCSARIQIPGDPQPAPPPGAPAGVSPVSAAAGWAPGAVSSAIASSAAAKVVKHLVVPVHTKPAEALITKPPVPLEVAARESDRQLRVKCIRRIECADVGHDHFDQVVSEFLGKLGEHNLVSVTAISYSHIDIGTQKLLNDYGVMIVYRG